MYRLGKENKTNKTNRGDNERSKSMDQKSVNAVSFSDDILALKGFSLSNIWG